MTKHLKCDWCGREVDVLIPVTEYGGPDGPQDFEWCQSCVDNSEAEPEEPGVVDLSALIHHMQGKAMDEEFGL